MLLKARGKDSLSSISLLQGFFIISIAWLFALYLLAWWNNAGRPGSFLYWNGDGEFFAWHAKALIEWSRPFDLLALNPFQGMVSTFLPYSPWWNPGAYVLSLPFKTSVTHLLSYSIYWFEAFFSMFFLARTMGLTKVESIFTGQAFIICFFPPFSSCLGTMPIVWMAPFFIHLMAVANLMVVLYLLIGKEKGVYNIGLIFILIFCSFVLFVSCPFYALIYAFAYGLMCVGLTFQHINKREFYWKISAVLVLAVALFLFKFPEYYKVLGDYSIRLGLPGPFIQISWPNSWNHYNFCNPALYGINFLSIFCPNKNLISYAYIVTFLGAAVSFFLRPAKYRWVSSAFLVVAIFPDIFMFLTANFIVKGRVTHFNPFYFGVAAQPFFVVFFVIFCSFLCNGLVKMWEWACFHFFNNRSIKTFLQHTYMFFHKMKITSIFVAIFLPLIVTIFIFDNLKKEIYAIKDEEKMPSSVKYLHDQLSLKPGDIFRGAALSYFIGENSPIGRRINYQPYSNYYHYLYSRLYLRANSCYGNMHMFSDLWKYDIPTIEEYAQMIAVPLHSFFQQLLNPAEQKEVGGHCLYAYDIDLRVLRALGVRFIVTDHILAQDGIRRTLEVTPPVSDSNIDVRVVEETRRIYEDLMTLVESKKLFPNEEKAPEISRDIFKDEFKKRLDAITDPNLQKDKDKVLGALSSLSAVVNKEQLNLSLDDLKKLKPHFYGYLTHYVLPPSLYLYEVENPNLATFSPTQPIYLTLEKDMFDLMKTPSFSFEKSVIVQDKDIPSSLVTAKNTQMRFKPNEVLVEAESDGWSLLLLPVQYSHCFTVAPLTPMASGENVRLIRANLIQSALLFQGKINVTLKFDFGVKCRSEDVAFWKSAQGGATN